MTTPQVAVILLNWNGWRDTVACIDSLLQSEYQNVVVVVCDNASTDDSWEQIHSWCQVRVGSGVQVWSPGLPWNTSSRIALIQTGRNLGFAGGCNVGIRFALQRTQSDFLWLLNNDTVVTSSCLTYQVRRMQADARLGLLGSTLVYAAQPNAVQCFGGYGFNFWSARVRPFSFAPDPQRPPGVEEVERLIRYVSGASTFVSRKFVESVGLMNEQYFLYFEEIDWAVRGKEFRISYCPESIVLHKEGGTIGSASTVTRRSRQSEVWLTRNRILFTRTFFPARLPVTLLWVLMVAMVRACTGKWQQMTALLQGTRNGLRAAVQGIPNLSDWPPETLRAGELYLQGAATSGNTTVGQGLF